MLYSLLADTVVLIHLLFIVFVVTGGVLARWDRKWAFVHLPAAAWAAAIEFRGWLCPLTPLENLLRSKAGQAGYAGGFIEHYLVPIIYPAALTREIQFLLGAAVILINAAVYFLALRTPPKKKP
ncbi:MAG: DUF2784 domain-containing protein [Desulfobulbaceae bacterium]|nr:DUF2784 domain-containing protein [Desulfobulbaceae bacterium]